MRPGKSRAWGNVMEHQPKDAPRPQQKSDDKPRQREATQPAASQQSGGTTGPGQMQSTQFTDWASI